MRGGRASQREKGVCGAVVRATRAGEFVEDVCVQLEQLADANTAAGQTILTLLAAEFPVRCVGERSMGRWSACVMC
jgi:hypothetical protein